jgi:hypothetical protein
LQLLNKNKQWNACIAVLRILFVPNLSSSWATPIIVIAPLLVSFIYFGNNKRIKSLAAGCCRRLDLLLD